MVLTEKGNEDSAAAVTKAGEAADQAREAAASIKADLILGRSFVVECGKLNFSCRHQLGKAQGEYYEQKAVIRAIQAERENLMKAQESATESYKAVGKEMEAAQIEGKEVRAGIAEAQRAADRAISATTDAANNLAGHADKLNNLLEKINTAVTNADRAAAEARNTADNVGKLQQEVKPTQGQTFDPEILKMILEKISRLESALIVSQSTGSSSSSKQEQLPAQQAQVQSQSVPHIEQDAKKIQHHVQHPQVQSSVQNGLPHEKQPEVEQVQQSIQQPQPPKTESQGSGSKRKASLALPQPNEIHHATKPKQSQQQGDFQSPSL